MKQGLVRMLQANQLLRVISSQSASTYANQVIAFVIPWLVLIRTGSVVHAGTVAFAIGAASMVGILAGGLITDRIGGRNVRDRYGRVGRGNVVSTVHEAFGREKGAWYC